MGKSTRATTVSAPRAAARLGWLDALRGFAALAVVFRHTGAVLVPALYQATSGICDAGTFGVYLFFLVSGYIVPASLERKGDLRAFWIGRGFRIYPVFLTVLALGLLVPQRLGVVSGGWFSHPLQTAAGNSVLLSELLGTGNGLQVSWTLSYEMVFYFLVSALFALGRHRRSAPISLAFAVLAVVAGAAVPTRMLSDGPADTRTVLAVVLLVLAAALACVMAGGRAARLGALTLGLTGLVLVSLNSGITGFDSMMILATMFAGTVIYRAEHGQIRRWTAVLCCALVLTAGLVSGAMYDGRFYTTTWTGVSGYCGAIAGAWLLFGFGLLMRRRRFPRFLSWLGSISYAVYLVHLPLYICMEWAWNREHLRMAGPLHELAHGTLYAALVLATAYAAHRLVELPGQRLGRRVTAWADARTGPRRAGVAAPAAALPESG
ncbi:acyltransferase [Streptacidiphilus sp. PB12-B1b]|uniref:acyltransferase family protein n=1 Tax=Streptacidiphilus sp. PB12-B1b TaxID=2705012 RepID=UPI0015FA830C|nr:acyltransferase [Streptacidiphilus sp. PB12-B1b]QMU75093.1 acyltransferase [Streptacidiphilus sp. PB12-B1b]